VVHSLGARAVRRSYWIAGEQGLVLLGTQLLPSKPKRCCAKRNRAPGASPDGRRLEPTPEQFNGTAALQKRGVKVYTSQQVAAAIPPRMPMPCAG
jgi:hypothetical protein